MSAAHLDGAALARKLRDSLSARIKAVKKAKGKPPVLAVVAGLDASSGSYLQAKIKACKEAGIDTAVESLSAWASQNEVLKILAKFSEDAAVDGIIVELPLPKHVNMEVILSALPPAKDAEGVTAVNYGRFFLAKKYEDIQAQKIVAPCTALAVIELLRETQAPLPGKRAVVAGRSNILGKPTAHLLDALDMTVTLCHSQTEDLQAEIARADVVVACLGKPRFIKGAWIKKGAVVIDAGIHEEGKKLCGDVEFEAAAERAAFITPVPGGVGPVTTAMLLANTVLLAERRLRP